MAAALALSFLPLSATAAIVPTVEPSNGFVTGPLPAWSSRHINSGTEDHRVLHKNLNLDLKTWKEENASRKNTPGYFMELRTNLMQRGHDHRVFHNWQTTVHNTDAGTSMQAIGGTPAMQSVTVNVSTGIEYTPDLPSRTFEGSRPSARLMQNAAYNRGIGR